MKLLSGKRVGQSGRELAEAAVFSFFLHVIILLAATFLFLNVTPKVHVPPFYEVKLVGPSPEAALPAAPSAAGQHALPKQEAKPAPKTKKAPPKAHKAPPKKGAMPELAAPKQKAAPEEAKPSEAPQEASKPSPPATGETAPGAQGGNVKVETQSDFKYGYYLGLVRDRIQQNWNPPPSVKGTKARITFTINRWGRIIEVNIDETNSTGAYDFKLAAMRAVQRSTFPELPEGFARQSLQFSVDLMEEE